jgi:hypothetical protein
MSILINHLNPTVSQINLLKQPSESHSGATPKIFEWILIVVLGGLIVYYGWLYFASNQADKNITATEIVIDQETQKALSAPQRQELITRQEQLKNLASLISSHVYWSQILPKLAQSTLKTATYSDLQINPDGTLTLSATVPTLADLDIYLQVFDLPAVNKYFSNVKISSFAKVQNLTSSAIKFQVTMNYDPSIINYSPPAGTNPNIGGQ